MFIQKGSSKLSATLLALILGASVFMAGQVWAAKYVTDPSTGKVVTAPAYGGTITGVLKLDWQWQFDTYTAGIAHIPVGGVVEKLGTLKWAMNRDEYHFQGGYMMPIHVIAGSLAESWEMADPLTYVFHIRKGVHWHNKAPMNGREFIADDAVFNFHRMLGMGSGFTEPSTGIGELGKPQWESITATDKYTVVFKLKQPYLRAVNVITDWYSMVIYPPEVIKEHGNMQDWKNLVGTGPFILTDYVEGSSLSYVKNPDYWGYDEKYPKNRLPYIDELKWRIMPEEATFLAALRAGQVDYVGWAGTSQVRSIDLIEQLKKTSPELLIWPFSEGNENVFTPNVSKPPFDDIRVRHALQMALDLETFNNSYFKGYGDTTPMGMTSVKGFYIPFEEWPQEVKNAYTYDPEGAEKLLDEAGYPRGSDGIRFKFALMRTPAQSDLSFDQLVGAYWRKIGVDMEIEVIDRPKAVTALRERNFEMGGTRAAGVADPILSVGIFASESPWNPVASNDPGYNALYEKALAAGTYEEQTQTLIEMDMHVIKKHWIIWGPDTPLFHVTPPWLKGYNGEAGMGALKFPIFARLWIDQDLKKEMGF